MGWAILIVGVIAAVAAVAAALYSRSGNVNAQATADRETKRWEAEIRPGPSLVIHPPGLDHAVLDVTVNNAGGAVRPGYLAVARDDLIFTGRYNAPSHNPKIDVHLAHTATTDRGIGVMVLAHFTRDVDGEWWDSIRGFPLDEAVPDPRDSGAFLVWCNKKWKSALDDYRPVTE